MSTSTINYGDTRFIQTQNGLIYARYVAFLRHKPDHYIMVTMDKPLVCPAEKLLEADKNAYWIPLPEEEDFKEEIKEFTQQWHDFCYDNEIEFPDKRKVASSLYVAKILSYLRIYHRNNKPANDPKPKTQQV